MASCWVQEHSSPPRGHWVGDTSISLPLRWFDQSLLTAKSPAEVTFQGAEPDGYLRPVAEAAWKFAHTLEIGDYVAIYVRRRGLYIGRVTGPYSFDTSGLVPHHSRTINIEEFVEDKWAVPQELWPLFSGLSRLIADETQVKLLSQVLNGTSPKPPSTRHLLFDELGSSDPSKSFVIGELALAESEEESSGGAIDCTQCGEVCTEMLHIDLIESAISGANFVHWSALGDFYEKLRAALDNGWLTRLPGETNLKVARKFLDVLIGEWTDDVKTPVLFGLRKAAAERWSWILVAFSADGGHPSSIDKAFPSRAETEAYLPTLGCRTGADLGPAQLKLFGVMDPEGYTL